MRIKPSLGVLGSGQFLAPDGSAAAPSYSFANDTNTGFFSAAADSIGVALSGAERIRFMSVSGGGAVRFLSATTAFLDVGGSISAAGDLQVARDASDVWAQRRGTNAQTLRVYGTFTDASNYERLSISTTAGTGATITPETAGTGADDLSLTLGTAGTGALIFSTGGTERGRIMGSAPVLILDEADANPGTSDLDQDDSIAIYTKADKLVFAYNNGGTMTYITLDLDGSDTTWSHSTSAP